MISGDIKEKDDIPWLGNKSNTPYCAYGDDTKYKEILLYAFIALQREKTQELETDILNIKNEFNIPADVTIHIKDFFNGHKREKLNINHLNVSALIDAIIDSLNKHNACVLFNYLKIPKNNKIYPDEFEIQGQKIHGDPKALAHQLGASCFVPFLNLNNKILNLQDFEVFVSSETTKVKVVGTQKRKAQYLFEMRIPLTNPAKGGNYARLKPHYINTNENTLLQVADVVAYVISHALSKKCSNTTFKKQMKKIQFIFKAPAG